MVHGKVATIDNQPGTLVISERAKVEGEVRVSHVVINGAVAGPVSASDHLELQAKAQVHGDVVYRTLEMHVGAIVQGKLMHVGQETADVGELKRATSERARPARIERELTVCWTRPIMRSGIGSNEPEQMMNAMTEMPAPFVFTDAAATKVKTLIDEEGNPDLKLRVFVTGGGCSGFQYGFTFDETVNEDDTSMEK